MMISEDGGSLGSFEGSIGMHRVQGRHAYGLRSGASASGGRGPLNPGGMWGAKRVTTFFCCGSQLAGLRPPSTPNLKGLEF